MAFKINQRKKLSDAIEGAMRAAERRVRAAEAGGEAHEMPEKGEAGRLEAPAAARRRQPAPKEVSLAALGAFERGEVPESLEERGEAPAAEGLDPAERFALGAETHEKGEIPGETLGYGEALERGEAPAPEAPEGELSPELYALAARISALEAAQGPGELFGGRFSGGVAGAFSGGGETLEERVYKGLGIR